MQSGSLAAAQVSTQAEELNRLQNRVDQAKQHLAAIASVYGPKHQGYITAANNLAEVQRQFDETRHGVTQRVETEYREAMGREQMLKKR